MRVGLVGSGRLATAISTALVDAAEVIPLGAGAATTGCAVLVLASDTWDTRPHEAVRDAARRGAIPWLPVRAELGRVVIGPVEFPGEPGCATCAERRHRRARENPEGFDAVWHRHGQQLRDRPSAWLTHLACHAVAALAADEALRAVRAPQTARTRTALLSVNLGDLTVTPHRFLPDPTCPSCGQLPDDTADAARLQLHSRPKPAPDTFRLRPLATELDRLVATYVDAEVGLVHALRHGHRAGLGAATALLGLPGNTAAETAFGRARDYRSAELVALLEALERYGGATPGGKRTVVHASYAEVRERAIDPRTLGLYPADRYALPGFGYPPFREDQPRHWVWAYSFARKEPVLVPEGCAYYRTRHLRPDDPPLMYESSNGCALGSCLEEAVLYGLLEVAERDAFLLTWHARLPVPEIDPRTAPDQAIPLLVEEIERDTGYRVRLFDTTMEQGVPCVWSLATLRAEQADRPTLACAAGAHLDPWRAVTGSLSELGPILGHLIRRYPEEAARVRAMVDDPMQVQAMADHSLLYGNPVAARRLDFLLDPDVRATAPAAPRQPAPPVPSHDLRDDLLSTVQRYLDTGLDVVVVDQTTPEHRTSGFSCVKVIIPGALPMTFGHQNRRLHGLPRLLTVPHLLGYRDRPLHPSEINEHPHPFP
jgi:ribosomal protein S12 methylthiotransferase accessory factor